MEVKQAKPFQHTERYWQIRTFIKQVVCLPLMLPCLLLDTADRSQARHLLIEDVRAWMNAETASSSQFIPILYLLSHHREFRNIYNLRLKQAHFIPFIASRILERFYPEERTLLIYTQDIGGGLYIQHGFATIIAAKKIGRCFHCNQQVTIGFKGIHAPVIGDHVSVRSGAIVIGRVNLGNHSIVGAGAVVTRDIEPYSTAIGVPARELHPIDYRR